MDLESIRAKVAEYNARISAQQARLEEAQIQKQAVEDRIQKEFGVSGDNLVTSLQALEQEAQNLGGKILEIVNLP